MNATVKLDQPFSRRWPLYALAIGGVFEYRFGRSPSITLLELISVAVWVQIFLDRVALGSRIDTQVYNSFAKNKWVVFFYVWSCICAFVAIAARQNTLNFWLLRDYFPAVTIVLAFSVYGFTKEQLVRLLWWYLGAAAVIACLGISQKLFGAPYIRAFHAVTDAKMDLDGKVIVGVFKSTGLFGHPNALAAFMLMPIGIAVAMLRTKGSGVVARLVLVLLLLTYVAALAGTYSKGAWAWAFLMALMIFLAPPRLFKYQSVPIIFSAIFTLAILFGSVYLASSGYKSFYTMLTRIGLWDAALHLSGGDWYVWLLGNGQLLFPWLSQKYSDISYPNAHSSLINIPVFYGVIGAVLFAGIVVGAFRSVDRYMRTSAGGWRIGWGFTVLLTVYSFYSIFEPHLEDGGNLAQFFLLIALSAGFSGMQARSKEENG